MAKYSDLIETQNLFTFVRRPIVRLPFFFPPSGFITEVNKVDCNRPAKASK